MAGFDGRRIESTQKALGRAIKCQQFTRATCASLYRLPPAPYNLPPLNAQPLHRVEAPVTESGEFHAAPHRSHRRPCAGFALLRPGRVPERDEPEQDAGEGKAAESNAGLPREVSDNILDQGYTVEGKELVDHLSVQSVRAPKKCAPTRKPCTCNCASVCRNPNYRKLMAQGAILRYEFTENKTNRPVASARFQESDCPAELCEKEEVTPPNPRAVAHRRAVPPPAPADKASATRCPPAAVDMPPQGSPDEVLN